MLKNTNKGFTLIELLVVISIIGLMSSIALAALNTARGKAANAAVKSNLTNARSEAALFYETNNQTYAGVCATTGDNIIGDNVSAAMTVGADPAALSARCLGEQTGWVAFSKLRVREPGHNGDSYYCVDSNGKSVAFDGGSIGAGVLALFDGLTGGERCP